MKLQPEELFKQKGWLIEDLNCIEMKTFSDKASTPMDLEGVKIEIKKCGKFLEVSQYLSFRNTTLKTLEGEFVLPLKEGTTVHSFSVGFGDEGELVDAVPVEKEKAEIAFEEVVRKRTGKVSVVKKVKHANVFKTKVYPLEPQKLKTIKIVVIETMKEDDESYYWFYNFVHSKYPKLKNFSVSFPDYSGDTDSSFVKDSQDFIELENPNFESFTSDLNGGILFQLGKTTKIEQLFQKDPKCGDIFFYSQAKLPLTPVIPKEKQKKFEKVTLFFDVSSSHKNGDLKKEINLILEEFDHFQKHAEKLVFRIITFSIFVHEDRNFSNRKEIEEFLTKQINRLDGGTSLPLDKILEVSEDSDIIFLHSDGISNFGKDIEEKLKKFRSPKSIFCFSSSDSPSTLVLNHLSLSTGGKYFNLNNVLEDNHEDTIFNSFYNKAITLTKLNYDISEFSEVFCHTIEENQMIGIVGKVLKPKGTIILEFGNIIPSIKIDIKSTNIDLGHSRLIPTLWANKKIEKLALFPEKNKEKILEIGLKYGITTSNTSLIVLTELEDYKKHKIIPPKCLKSVRKQYFNGIQQEEQTEQERIKSKIEEVAIKWEKRIEWHKKDFSTIKKNKKTKKKTESTTIDEAFLSSEENECRCFSGSHGGDWEREGTVRTNNAFSGSHGEEWGDSGGCDGDEGMMGFIGDDDDMDESDDESDSSSASDSSDNDEPSIQLLKKDKSKSSKKKKKMVETVK